MNNSLYALILVIFFTIYACQEVKYVQGERIYEAYCLQCHMQDGSGLGSLYPSLDKSAYLLDRKSELVCLIREGIQSTELSNVRMPEHKNLKEAELSNLVNYICDKWGDQKPIKITDIRAYMKECP